jgi:hypothetical protein
MAGGSRATRPFLDRSDRAGARKRRLIYVSGSRMTRSGCASSPGCASSTSKRRFWRSMATQRRARILSGYPTRSSARSALSGPAASPPPESAGRLISHRTCKIISPNALPSALAAVRGRLMTKPAMSLIEACDDPDLFAPWFKDRATWAAWFCFLRVLFGLPMTAADLTLYEKCTGRTDHPPGGFHESWLVCGRRAGKSFVLALIAVFIACFHDWSPYLTPGERGGLMIVATDRRQARTIFRYLRALIGGVPLLASMIERETADAIDLSNGVTIEILTASFRSVRGYTLIAALLDELAFWRSDESANPDTEILEAIRPAMASVPGAMLLCASSPYARRGALWNAHKRHFGKPGSVLVWQADTRTMNPTISQELIGEAYEDDPASAAAEYGAEFRTDVETFVSREVVEAAIVPGRFELPPVSGVNYHAFVDPSGGSSDSMTLAIGHRDQNGVAIVDAIRERRPPFSPETVCSDFCMLLRSYHIRKVCGDRFAGEWVREPFKLSGIEYELSDRPKSDVYRDVLPALNSGKVELLDHPRLVSQLCSLERRTARGGRDSIDHPPGHGAHDDIANSVCGAVLACAGPQPWIISDELLRRSRLPGRATHLSRRPMFF